MSQATHLTMDEIERQVCDLLPEVTGGEGNEVHPHSRLIEDLHFDSLDFMDLFFRLEKLFCLSLDPDSFSELAKTVFTRRPFRVRDVVEVVYLQQGTALPVRAGWRRRVVQPAPAALVLPFTQLDGRWSGLCPGDRGSIFEPVEGERGAAAPFRRRTDGMRCIPLPSAEVEIGSDGPHALRDERPVHRAGLDSFLIDAEPVSVTAYCRFLNSIDPAEEHLQDWFLLDPRDDRQAQMTIERRDAKWRALPGTERLPMVLVSWFGASAYSLWANGEGWSNYRQTDEFLPSETQWEYAARGERSQPFPWGEVPDTAAMAAARHVPGDSDYRPETMPMAAVNETLGMSPFGLHHMAGNVWQWCRDWYAPGFYEQLEARGPNPVNRTETGVRSERGGSWVGPPELCRSSYRRGRNPAARGRCLGFRCISQAISLPKLKSLTVAGGGD